MTELKIESILFMPATRESKEFLKGLTLSSQFPADRKVASGQGVLGMAVVNGSIAGALCQQINAQHTDKKSVLYVLYNADGKYELDSESVEAALKAGGHEKAHARNVTMTDSDQQFLTKLGGGNVSSGLRVAVELARLARSWADR